MDENKQKLSERKVIISTSILIVIVCFFAIYLRLFTQRDLWYEMLAAVIGVIITAIITMILLRGQSNNDVERERASKVFEEKLRIYQEYLQTLYDVIQDGGLSDKEKLKLEFQTSYIAMHCSSKYIADVSVAVKNIIEITCSEKSESDEKKAIPNRGSPEPTLANLFRVVEAFRRDLYGSDFSFDPEYKNNTLTNFSSAYLNAKNLDDRDNDEKRLTVDLNVVSGSLVGNLAGNVTKDLNKQTEQIEKVTDSDWLYNVQKWKDSGWSVREATAENDFISLHPEGENESKEIKIYFWEGKYIIQALYDWRAESADFTKPLKWKYGGRRSKGCWWTNLPEQYSELQEGSLALKFSKDKSLRDYVIKNFNELKELIEAYRKSEVIKNKIKAPEGLHLYIWYWESVVGAYDKEDEGSIEVWNAKDESDENINIYIGNTEKNTEKLDKTLARIGVKNYEYNDFNDVLVEVLPSTADDDSIVVALSHWMEKIVK